MSDTVILVWLCGLVFVVLLNSYWIGRLEARIAFFERAMIDAVERKEEGR